MLESFSYTVIDFETTGFPPNGEIIEIGMVKVTKGQIESKYSKLVKPEKPIPDEITILTGISNEMVGDKPSWSDIAEEVINFIGNSILIAHNVDFDKGFLERALGYQLANLWVDTWDLSKISLPTLPSYQLKYLADYLQLKQRPFHRAISDAETTAEIFICLIREISTKSPHFLEQIINIIGEGPGGGYNGLNIILKSILKEKITHYWVNQKSKITSEEQINTKETKLPIPFSNLEEFFLPKGLLSSALNNYEFRPQQLEVAKIIQKALINNYHGLIEAATGTGKSLAYLIPALLWAQENDTKIIISTNTIPLQEQLYHVDIPFLEENFNCKLPVSLVKGRNNYLCLRRYYKLLRDNDSLDWQEKIFLAQITGWLEQTQTGDREELNLNSFDNELWINISSQTETCLGNKCAYAKQCYYLKTRKKAETSKIIITNHSLLLLDIKRDNKVLPQNEYVIIDEAHNLEDETLNQFAQEFNFKSLKRALNQLVKGKNTALINRVLNYFNQPHVDEIPDNLFQIISTVKADSNYLETKLEQGIKYINSQDISLNYEYRITSRERKSEWWNNFSHILNDIANYLRATINNINSLINKIELMEELEEPVKEIGFLLDLLAENFLTITKYLEGIDENLVYWMQISNHNLVLIITPLNINNILSEKLFSKKKSVILTSATLTVNDSFNHIMNLLGLEEEKVLTLISQSPFDYQQQSIIYIPKDAPEPCNVSEKEFEKYVTTTLAQLLPHVYGGTLVLFTSHQMLNNVYYGLKKEEALFHKEILAHGKDGGRKILIETLKKNPHKVILMGTSSFWEGIDIQGLGLTALIIVKLPFIPPTRPVVAARLESLENNNKNSFYTYSLPTAILKFRQGYGRLIRTKKDWGALIILDKRVISKNYGSRFIRSLPSQPIIKSSTNDIVEQLSYWMKKNTIEK